MPNPKRAIRWATYYAALFFCVIIAIGVSFGVVLYLARSAAERSQPSPEARAEAQALHGFLDELKRVHTAIASPGDPEPAGPGSALHRRVQDIRRRLRIYPNESAALSALIRCGDRMHAWAGEPSSVEERERAQETLRLAEEEVERRAHALEGRSASR